MNINQFAKYLLDCDTENADKLWGLLYTETSVEEDQLNTILENISNNETPVKIPYMSDLLEWLNNDSSACDYVDDVINGKHSNLYELLRAGKLEQYKQEYQEVHDKLEELLSEHSIELTTDNKSFNIDDILDKL